MSRVSLPKPFTLSKETYAPCGHVHAELSVSMSKREPFFSFDQSDHHQTSNLTPLKGKKKMG